MKGTGYNHVIGNFDSNTNSLVERLQVEKYIIVASRGITGTLLNILLHSYSCVYPDLLFLSSFLAFSLSLSFAQVSSLELVQGISRWGNI